MKDKDVAYRTYTYDSEHKLQLVWGDGKIWLVDTQVVKALGLDLRTAYQCIGRADDHVCLPKQHGSNLVNLLGGDKVAMLINIADERNARLFERWLRGAQTHFEQWMIDPVTARALLPGKLDSKTLLSSN